MFELQLSWFLAGGAVFMAGALAGFVVALTTRDEPDDPWYFDGPPEPPLAPEPWVSMGRDRRFTWTAADIELLS